MTNSSDVLQKKFQENERKIVDTQREVNLLREKYHIHDTSPTQLEETNLALASSEEPYWTAKRSLANMIDFQKLLTAKIQAVKIDEQIKAQTGSH